MKIVVAFDSFKGCLSASEVCHAASVAIKQVLPNAEVIEVPLSDGGEGMVQSVLQVTDNLHEVTCRAHGPLMEELKVTYLLSSDGQTAFMEMAAAAGLPLVPEEKRNPMLTTTYGVGDMLMDAVRRGCSRIIMGIGGSATCDGGRGMLQCLREHDANLDDCKILVACDVNNPLFGENGAAYVFAPQKGATPEQVIELDHQLRLFAKEAEDAGIATPSLAKCPGAGAAGGLGYGLMAYLGAELQSGIDLLLNITRFDDLIKGADLVITGEGKSDVQTMMGKVPQGVLSRARRQGVPVCLMSGAIEDADGVLSQHFDSVCCINEGDDRPLSVLMQSDVAKQNLAKTIEKLVMMKVSD